MFGIDMNMIIGLGLHGDGVPFAAKMRDSLEQLSWSLVADPSAPGFCSQLFQRVQCWAGNLGMLCSRCLHGACSSWHWADGLHRVTQGRPGPAQRRPGPTEVVWG
jgi:hypothetical protein